MSIPDSTSSPDSDGIHRNQRLFETQAESNLVLGIYLDLGKLPPGTPLTEDGLAKLMDRSCRETIKRSVERGELPPPVRIMGKNTWTAGTIIKHIEQQLEVVARRNTKLRS